MDYIINATNVIKTGIVFFFGEAWFANVITFVMGIFGTLAFFSQKQKKLKPIVMQHGNIAFIVTEKNIRGEKYIYLNGIELSLGISNLKNAIGILEDLFVRIYTTDSYQPETVFYFATKLTIDDKESDFTPFILSPNSHVSMKVLFGQVEQYRSEKIIDLSNQYAIDIFYKLKGTNKPLQLTSITIFNKGEIVNNRLDLLNLSLNIKRDKYYKVRDKTYNTNYKGLTNFYFNKIFDNLKIYLFYMPKRYILGFFETIFYLIMFIFTNMIAFFISKKIIIHEGKNIRSPKITCGNKEHRVETEKIINKIYICVEKLTNEMNDGLSKNDKIVLNKQQNSFVLSRFGKQINVYPPGDSSIYAQILENEKQIDLKFELKKSSWGIKYWCCDGKFITKYNIAIKIIDYFTLATLIRR